MRSFFFFFNSLRWGFFSRIHDSAKPDYQKERMLAGSGPEVNSRQEWPPVWFDEEIGNPWSEPRVGFKTGYWGRRKKWKLKSYGRTLFQLELLFLCWWALESAAHPLFVVVRGWHLNPLHQSAVSADWSSRWGGVLPIRMNTRVHLNLHNLPGKKCMRLDMQHCIQSCL